MITWQTIVIVWFLLLLLIVIVLICLGWKKDITPSEQEWQEFVQYMRRWNQKNRDK
jgi:F0F1-type ATP synthase membrane subunit a